MVPTTPSNVDERDIDLEVGGSEPQKASSPPGPSQTKSETLPMSSNRAGDNAGNPAPSGPPDSSSDPPRMIGDFDGNANALWTLYGKEAKSHDESRIESLKDDMDGVLIFAGLFSAVLTAFIIDSKQNLKVSPTDQMVYYLQQNVAVLDQISRQISSIVPQFSIPSTPPAPFPAFKPSASDMRVNVFWFMSLIFSLSAALLATLVQQWVRDYMHVFQQYSDPLKSARLRQYLHEGSENWLMHPVAEAVPALLHVSLFLFFIGLCDFVFNINTKIGISTTIPIAITGFLYILTTVAPVINPQSPYQNSFSGLIWYMIQKFGVRRFKNRGFNGQSKSVDSNMARGQMQLAMEETEDRKGRDERAVRWLVSNMTEDAEMESFVMAIPGSFNGPWGEKVWTKVLKNTDEKSAGQNQLSRIQNLLRWITSLVRTSTGRDTNANTAVNSSSLPQPNSNPHSTTHIQGEDIMSEFSERVAHLLGKCKNQGPESLPGRTRACVETTASLVFLADAKLGQFGDLAKLLGDIGNSQTVRESSSVGKDHSFVMRWTCLSLVAIRPILQSTWVLHNDARRALRGLGYSTGEARLQKIINAFNNASSCLQSFAALPVSGATEERVSQILEKHESRISKLEQIDIENADLESDDSSINTVQQTIDQITHGIITRQLPGVKSDISTEDDDVSQFIELYRDRHTLLFLSPLRNLRRIRSFAQTIRDTLQEPDVDALQKFQKSIKDLQEIEFPLQSDNLFRRQMWRLLDLQDGGLGFIVELFFLALKQLLPEASSEVRRSALYICTFRTITSEWSKYKKSLGTQKLLLDMVVPYRGIIFIFDYPPDIVTEFLEFLGNILKGQRGQYIDDITEQLDNATHDAINPRHRALSTEALHFIRAAQSSS